MGVNLKERADGYIFGAGQSRCHRSAKIITFVNSRGTNFSHNCPRVYEEYKGIKWKRGVHVCVDTGEEDERKLFDMQHDARLD